MNTVQQLEPLGASQRHNAYSRLSGSADNLAANLPVQRDKLRPLDCARAAVRPAFERAVSTDEEEARVDHVSKYSKCCLEPNAFVASMRSGEDVGRPHTAVDGRCVVYVVDDDVSVRRSLAALIRLAGWRCELYASVREFLSKPKIVEHSCLVLDYDLPDVTGPDLQLKLPDSLSEMPIVFLTVYADVRMAVEAMKSGAIDFLTKPCDDDVLLAAIQKAFERGREMFDDSRMARAICERRATRAEAQARDTERRYREVQLELEHANRVATVGQLSASIAHEVNQPIAAVITNTHTALRWLDGRPPNLEKARQALGRILENGNRAGEVIAGIRALIKKEPPRQDRLAMNEMILEVIAMTRGEALKNEVSVRTRLAKGLPIIEGDKVQLQQVILNLIINAIQAMTGVNAGLRELLISTDEAASEGVLIAVADSGPGLAQAGFERPFEAFYTTKPGGLGMGLPICRSIIEAHGGRLWATANLPRGAIFQFTAATPPEANWVAAPTDQSSYGGWRGLKPGLVQV